MEGTPVTDTLTPPWALRKIYHGVLGSPEAAPPPRGLWPDSKLLWPVACGLWRVRAWRLCGLAASRATSSGVAQTAPGHFREEGIQQGAAARKPGPSHLPPSASWELERPLLALERQFLNIQKSAS